MYNCFKLSSRICSLYTKYYRNKEKRKWINKRRILNTMFQTTKVMCYYYCISAKTRIAITRWFLSVGSKFHLQWHLSSSRQNDHISQSIEMETSKRKRKYLTGLQSKRNDLQESRRQLMFGQSENWTNRIIRRRNISKEASNCPLKCLSVNNSS